MFTIGEKYKRSAIHDLFGGQRQGGISTPSKHKMILLFTSERGKEHGYSDGWQSDGRFFYTGEGQIGDMDFIRGNKAIRDHLETGHELHLFKRAERSFVEYVGRFVCDGYHYREGRDTIGQIRKMIVFELRLVE